MPWKECKIVNERMRFVLRLESGERMTDLCAEFGISRKTGYKILKRYNDLGPSGLFNESRRPYTNPNQTDEYIEHMIITLKDQRPTWGPDKLRAFLRNKHPKIPFPSRNTFYNILLKHDLVKKRKKRSKYKSKGTTLRETASPNELWCIDFKGDYFLGNKKRCYPLTLSDHYSRYILNCTALETKGFGGVFAAMEDAFTAFGVPKAIRSDNGTPFSSTAILGLSKLNVWWMKLGIDIELTRPANPQDNGRHERMHRTLKEDVLKFKAKNVLHQQEIFDDYIIDFNTNRPHEALKNKTPSDMYTCSSNEFHILDYDYRECELVKRVSQCGSVSWENKKKFFISEAIGKEEVGIKEVENKMWRVQFRDVVSRPLCPLNFTAIMSSIV